VSPRQNKKWHCMPQLYQKVMHSLHFHYTVVQINNFLKSASAIKLATMIHNYGWQLWKEAIMSNQTFAVSQKWMGHKGKSMKNALYILQYAKRYLLSQSCSLTIIGKIMLVWRYQSVSQQKIINFEEIL